MEVPRTSPSFAHRERARRGGHHVAGAAAALLIALRAILWPVAADAAAKCTISKVAELPITMDSLKPTITAKINGREARFILDSGAFYSMISSAIAAEYGLKPYPGPYWLEVTGLGGSTDVRIATVKEFTLIGVVIKNVDFLVGGGDVGSAGVLGQNLLERFDVEYDLLKGAIRLFHSDECDHTRLAYWLTEGQAYSELPIDRIDPLHPHTLGSAYVNGQKIRVIFDSGASTSMLSTKAAERAGVKTDKSGAVPADYSRGIGRAMVKTYIAPVASFAIGDGEEIKNTKLRIADVGFGDADMLLGADFFVSHRIFVANKEHKLFLSYNGGPVFNLSQDTHAPSEPAAGDNTREPSPGSSAMPADAAELARLGSALAARRDFSAAIVDLTKAVELSPDTPEYYYRRANAYMACREGKLALADYDQVIRLKPEFLPAYIPRAELHLADHDFPAAVADLESVDRLAPKQADLRFMLAQLYQRIDRMPEAVAQYTLWMDSHPDDSRMIAAFAGRCSSGALGNQGLSVAMSDCNAALRRADKTNTNYSQLYIDRGLVRLRLGRYEEALADFNDALKISGRDARALYARGIAESRTKKAEASEADLAAARQLAPQIGARFERFGILP